MLSFARVCHHIYCVCVRVFVFSVDAESKEILTLASFPFFVVVGYKRKIIWLRLKRMNRREQRWYS